ncbi:protein of unknown function [Nitrospira defluvii]|uniref:Uncharacterized protein n=1 Tax=Nitrospira defluvii TaxID=330214 RepID=D8PE46_9BACT|nr:protein of unknown function [Nitrospira defluvii]
MFADTSRRVPVHACSCIRARAHTMGKAIEAARPLIVVITGRGLLGIAHFHRKSWHAERSPAAIPAWTKVCTVIEETFLLCPTAPAYTPWRRL